MSGGGLSLLVLSLDTQHCNSAANKQRLQILCIATLIVRVLFFNIDAVKCPMQSGRTRQVRVLLP